MNNVSNSLPQSPTRRTVDGFTRMLHVLLFVCFTGAYLTAESEVFRLVHVTLGYTLGGLLVVRVLWGLWGPRHARFSALWGKLRGAGAWLRAARAAWAPPLATVTAPASASRAALPTSFWQQAQNLYIAASVALLLLVIWPVVASGYVNYQEWAGDWIEDVHAFFGNLMLAAVLAHVAGIVAVSLLRRRNLAMPMLTGRVVGAGPDVAKHNHAPLAVLLLVAVLAFWGWQWQDAPANQAAGVEASTLHPAVGPSGKNQRSQSKHAGQRLGGDGGEDGDDDD